MNWTFESENAKALRPFRDETHFINNLKKLSLLFTRERHRIEEYLENEALVSAYHLFYAPTNRPKFQKLLGLLPEEVRKRKNLEIVDLGCGPGSLFRALEGGEEFSLIGVDKSELMLKQAAKAFTHPRVQWLSHWSQVAASETERLVVFGHSLNEMPLDEAKECLQVLAPDWLAFVEPGTPRGFEQLLELRTWLIEKNYFCHFPCLRPQANCPMQDQENWCHQMVLAEYSKELERICQIVKLDRRRLPCLIHLYAKQEVKKTSGVKQRGRLIQILTQSKAGIQLVLCLGEQELRLQRCEVLKRHHSRDELKNLAQKELGQTLEFECLKVLESEDLWRIQVSALV